MHLSFETLFKTPINAMILNRSYPLIPKDLKWIIQFSLSYGYFLFGMMLVFYNAFAVNLKNRDYINLCCDGSCYVMFAVISFKYFTLVFYQDAFIKIIKMLKEDYETMKELPEEEQASVITYAKKGVKVTKYWEHFAFITLLVFPLKPIFQMIYYTIVDEFRLVNMYDIEYPSFLANMLNEVSHFFFTFITMGYFFYYAYNMYLGLVPMGPVFMLHACGQVEVIITRVKSLFPDEGYDPEIAKQKMISIIQQNQRVYLFVDEIQIAFKTLYEITLKGTSIIMPVLALLILRALKTGELHAEFVSIFVGAILLSSIPCYYGDALLEKGEDLRFAIYSSGWENHWDKRLRSMLLIQIIRSSRSVMLRTLFLAINLENLAAVFNQAYALFNLLNASLE